MTTDLTAPLAATLASLESGWPIDRLNSARRAQEQQKMTDARETILWRIDEAVGGWINPVTARDLLADCAAEIRQRDVKIAEMATKMAKAKSIARDLLIVIQCHADKLDVTSADVAEYSAFLEAL